MAGVAEPPADRLRPGRAAPWRDERVRAVFFQLVTLALILALIAYLAGNAVENLRRQGIATGFGFLNGEAAFAIAPTLIPYSPADSYARALLAGVLNTLLVSVLGIIFATLLGFVVGVARLSGNWLLSRLALAYVELFRNTPLVLQLFVWWDALRLSAPQPASAAQPLPGVFYSNRGLAFPVPLHQPLYGWMAAAAVAGLVAAVLFGRWARARKERTGQAPSALWIGLALVILPPAVLFIAGGAPLQLDLPHATRFGTSGGQTVTLEFAALLLALTVYTAAFIGEIVRGGIQAVSRGQTEAALALGLSRGQVLRLVVLPQAIRIIIPPTTNEYLNLAKNSSLAVAIGFADFMSVANTTLNQTGQSVSVYAIVIAVYLAISLFISLLMNIYNRWTALVER